VLVSFNKFITATAVASLLTVSLPAQDAPAQQPQQGAPQGQAQPAQGAPGEAKPASGTPAQKNWKDRAEYDMFQAITKEPTPAKRLELINQWAAKYPATDFKLEKELLYLDTYQKLGQAPKILESAEKIIAIDPQNLTALYWMAYLTTSMNDTAEAALARGEKAANSLLGALDTAFAADKKPKETTAEQWKKARTDMEALAHKTLGWVAMIRKNGDLAQEHFAKSLQLNPAAGEVSYWMGQTIVAEKKPETYSNALYHMARASAYDGPGALPAEGRKQVDDYLTKAYTGFHGDTSGLAELKQTAKANPLPSAGFKVKSVREIAEEKLKAEQAFAEANPMIAMWRNLKQGLTTDENYWGNMEGTLLPRLKGTVVSANPKEIVLAMSDATTPEVTLEFEAPVRADEGSTLEFEAVAKSFTKEPFMLTLTAEKDKVSGLSTAPAKKPARSKPRRK
jgi:tetratricopeptide (TPR) repeat protein